METKQNNRLRMVLCMAMLMALAIAADFFLRIPGIGGFLTYEPKDAILTIGGFIFGPAAGILMALIVCFIEMVTVSTTGLIGLLMNFLASAVFVGVSTAFYIKKKTLQRAIIGLVAGSLSMTVIMLLWNYIVTPMYMGVPREAVLGMILPLLLPFNLLKASLNSAVVMALYKGVVTALRKSKLLLDDKSESKGEHKSKTIVIVSISAFLVVTLVLVVLIFAGIIKF